MHSKRNIAIAAAALLLMTGCSTTQETSPESEESAAEASTAPAEVTAPEDDAETTEEAAPEENAESSPDSDAESDSNTVSVTIDGETEEITFSDAYCSGPQGEIKNIIGKVNNRPPLLKVSGSEHVMLKMGEERPYESQVSEGLDISGETVTFDEVSVEGATIDGALTCTSWD
ncbi:MAG TPA: hypothetical protein H9884_08615 [Candidatus Yaniella excrementigallinarum]|nr:hypothetical protein [Candidatus Yaniella excrementigallinarum]